MPLSEEYEATAVAGTTLYVLDGYPAPTKAHKYSCNTDMWSSVKRAPLREAQTWTESRPLS